MNLSQNIKSNTSVKYHFSIPDSSVVWVINMPLLQAMQEHPDWFYDDFTIDSCYGCFPRCIWNGNREALGPKLSDQNVEGIVRGYSDFGIKYRLTFTNFLLQQEHLRDEYGNFLAMLVSRYAGEVIASTPMMYEYIRNNYSQLSITWSTTTDFGETKDERLAKINELSKTNAVVVPYDFNNNQVLGQLLYPYHIEVMVNEMCIDNCPRRREHHRWNNEINLTGQQQPSRCFFLEKQNTREWHTHSIIGRNGLGKYAQLGLVNFKLVGRTDFLQSLSGYLHYFLQEDRWGLFLSFVEKFYRSKLIELKVLPDDGSDAKGILSDFSTKIYHATAIAKGLQRHGEQNNLLW